MDYLYSLYDALVSINVPSGKARAVVDAMERDMESGFKAMRSEHARDLKVLGHSMTIRLGSLQMAMGGAIVAVLRFWV